MKNIQNNRKEISKSTIILVILLIITILSASGFAIYAWAKYTSKNQRNSFCTSS